MSPEPETERRQRPSAESMSRLVRLASACVIPAVVLTFAVYFFVSVRDLLPQSRYYPQAVSAILVALGVLVLAAEILHWVRPRPHVHPEDRGATEEADRDTTVPAAEKWTKIVSCVALTTAYVFSLSRIGFYTATFLYTLLTTLALQRRGPLVPLVMAVSVTASSYLLLSYLVGVPLPSGLFI